MAPTAGTYELGPDKGELLLRTTTEGAMAKMGHALTIRVDDWHATLVLGESPETSSLRVTADLRSLAVIAHEGGAKPASEGDKTKILQNAHKALGVDHHPELTFTSTAMAGTWDEGKVEGQATIAGRTEVQRFDVRAEQDDAYVLTGEVVQTRYGIKPFSTMMGQLRLGDAVAIEARVRL